MNFGTAAVIGSVGHSDDTLYDLIGILLLDNIPPLILDNRGTLDRARLQKTFPQALVRECPDMNIHQVWNFGMDYAAGYGAGWAAILNDDVRLMRGAIPVALDLVDMHPHSDEIVLVGLDSDHVSGTPNLRPAVGSFREHGVPGFAYLIRLDAQLRYDDRFVWWGGDDDLVWRALTGSPHAAQVAEGCWVHHPAGGNTTGRHYPELGEAIAGDRQLLLDKWGKAW
jgi:hypothetical protein